MARLLDELGMTLGPTFGRRGSGYLLTRIVGFNRAAAYSPWIVLFDLDRHECPPRRISEILPTPSDFMCLRIAVRSIESWLLADPERLAPYLGIRRSAIPADPDGLPNPKDSMVQLARASSRALVRQEMVPRPGSGFATGSAYTARLISFVSDRDGGWRPSVAAAKSDSLGRCIRAIESCAARYRSALHNFRYRK
jgi:hypothetical protein